MQRQRGCVAWAGRAARLVGRQDKNGCRVELDGTPGGIAGLVGWPGGMAGQVGLACRVVRGHGPAE